MSIDAVVLDIEGTTSSTGFVHDTLYPYSRARFRSWIAAHDDRDDVAAFFPGLEYPDTGDRARLFDDLLDEEPLLTEELLGLCMWISEYYEAAPGETVIVRGMGRGAYLAMRWMRVTRSGGRFSAGP